MVGLLGATDLGKMFTDSYKFTNDVILPYDNNLALVLDLGADKNGRPIYLNNLDSLKKVRESIDSLEKKIGKYLNSEYSAIKNFARAIKGNHLDYLKKWFNNKAQYVQEKLKVSTQMAPGQKVALNERKESLDEMVVKTKRDLQQFPELMYNLR
jgi:hypothetical protein